MTSKWIKGQQPYEESRGKHSGLGSSVWGDSEMRDPGKIWGELPLEDHGHIWKCFQECACVRRGLHRELRLKASRLFLWETQSGPSPEVAKACHSPVEGGL